MRDHAAVKNSVITLICQISNILLGFITRKLFLEYIGIELLGVNSTISSILNALSLAELGFESAVIFRLYKPVSENRVEEIESIVAVLRRFYEFVGAFIILTGIVVSFFLQDILTGTQVNAIIYISFFLQLASTAVTYILAYKRTILLSLQKAYVYNICISSCKIPIALLQIASLIFLRSYLIYVALNILLMLTVNILVSLYVDKTTVFRLKNKKIDKAVFRMLAGDVKEIFLGKIANYIYNSTDNLIVSVCVGTVSVGLLGNYTQILYQLRSVFDQIFESAQPVIGHFLTAESRHNYSFKILRRYTFIRFCTASVFFVPGFVLCDCFVTSWLGADYVLSKLISGLLVTDIYIHFVQGAVMSYITGLGYFRQDRKIAASGAVINIVLSLFLVRPLGLAGVLAGTVVSQIFHWIARSILLFRAYFHGLHKNFRQYWASCFGYTLIFYLLCGLCWFLFSRIPLPASYFSFVLGGFLCVGIIMAVLFLLFARTDEFSYLLALTRKMLPSLQKYNAHNKEDR